MQSLDIPEWVRARAAAQGDAGRDWLHALRDFIRELERDWNITVGASLHGGSAGYVATATTADGSDAVLKLQMPGWDGFTDEVRVMLMANGRGYARVLRHDNARRAVLLERLGRPLRQLGLPTSRQIEIMCATLQQAWIQTPEAAGFPTGAEKARDLRRFIAETWQATGRPCSEAVVEQALAFTVAREQEFDPARAVLGHGDAHHANTLESLDTGLSSGSGFKFVDPEPMFIERAYDLGVLIRDWSTELLAGDALSLGRQLCTYVSDLTGENPVAIWQWAFIERVSTGLVFIALGFTREGREFLKVAEAWVQT